MNLLVVDDEYYIVQGIIGYLDKEQLGIDKVYPAYSADQARHILEKKQVDLMICDIELPKENGLELMDWMRSKNIWVTTIVLSGHQRFDYAQTALELHCYSYILKPVTKVKLNNVLSRAIRSMNPERPAAVTGEAAPKSEELESDFVRTVRKYITDHLNDPELNRSSIAEAIHMNPDYLSYCFHNEFGETLTAYIVKTRIDQARYLIKNSFMPINTICYEVGFKSVSYFYKQFKRLTGLTPQQYKE